MIKSPVALNECQSRAAAPALPFTALPLEGMNWGVARRRQMLGLTPSCSRAMNHLRWVGRTVDGLVVQPEYMGRSRNAFAEVERALSRTINTC
jgi:hypothetical protein